jgi:uncharacterized membrane protein YccC
MVVLTSLSAASAMAAEDDGKVGDAVLIGAFGVVSVAAYSLGAYFTGDERSGFVLATIGGVSAGSMLGTWIGFAINASMKDRATIASRILFPTLLGLAGGLAGGLSAGFASDQPGTGRTVTHGVVIGVLITDTIIAELVTLLR